MELTEEKITQLLRDLGQLAKRIRDGIPYSQTDGFTQMVLMLGPNLEPGLLPVTWKNGREKQEKMRAVSQVAKETLSQAVVVITDTRWADEKNIIEMFGIPSLNEIGIEEFHRLYIKNLQEKYQGSLENAPAHCYKEAIVIVMKGPMCGERSLMLPYTKGFDDKVRWLKPDEHPNFGASKVVVDIKLIPAWWS